MVRYIQSLGLAILLSVGIGGVGHAASFDCNKATTETEIAICSDPELSALDEGLHIAYRDIFVSNFDDVAETAKSEQRNWIMERNICGFEVSCLVDKYKKRHVELSNANYDSRHKPFTGSFLPSTMNGSLTSLLNTTLKDWDLVAVDSIIGASYLGMSITTAFIVREKSINAIQSCGMDICNSNPAYFALIDGSIDENFSGTNVQFHPVDDLVQDSVEVTLNVLSRNRVEIRAYWLRGGSTVNARYSQDKGLTAISERTGGVISPASGTMYSETYLFEQDIYLKEYGYIFGEALGLLPRSIGLKDAVNPCEESDFRTCDERDLYDLAVQLYSEPKTIHESLRLFSYLNDLKYEPAKKAYAIVSQTISEMSYPPKIGQ